MLQVLATIFTISCHVYVISATDIKVNCMELERNWVESCIKDGKCPPPGLRTYKSKSSKPKKKQNEYDGIECNDDGFINLKNESYPCKNTKLLSYLTLEDLGSTPITLPGPDGTSRTGSIGSDIWGYTDKKNNKLYGLTCQHDGASIVEVTDPTNPRVIAFIPTAVPGVPIIWRDIKVYKNYMYIGADFGGGGSSNPVLGNHSLQYYNLDNLENIDTTNGVYTIPSDDIGLYTQFKECHNLVINEDSGYLYAVGTDTCNGGLHIVDINDPGNPTFVACFEELGYIHDGQCVNIKKRELCFTANTDLSNIAIVDVTDKENIFTVSQIGYGDTGTEARFTHQLWTTPNHEYLLLNDELDEFLCGCDDQRTRTYVFNIADVENPIYLGTYYGTEEAVSHNLYIDDKGKYAYLSNYLAGLRILDITGLYDVEENKIDSINEVAYFDTFPEEMGVNFGGVWSSYIYFNKFVLIQTLDKGLFIIEPLLKKSKKSNQEFYYHDFSAMKSNLFDNSTLISIAISVLYVANICFFGYYVITKCCFVKVKASKSKLLYK